MTPLILLLLTTIAYVLGAFEAGLTNPTFVDSLKTGIAATSGGKTYANCQFFTLPDAAGTLMKLYWTIVGDTLQLSVAMDFKTLKQGGWFAIGISDAPATANPMTNATIVLAWVDRFGNGYGYVANAKSTATVAPTFTDPPTVANAVIGVSQVIKGQDDLVVMSFDKPVSTWVGANKQLMFAFKESDGFDPSRAPDPGKPFPGTKHTESLKVADFNFAVPSPVCALPGTTPVEIDPCVTTPLGSFSNGVVVPLGDTTVQINALFDCAAKEVEFTVTGESDGWLAFGFNDAKQMLGTDTYQIWIDDQGLAKVRNGHVNAVTRNVIEDAVLTDVAGFRDGRLLSITFRRKFDTGSADDKPLAFGKKYIINVSRNDVKGALPTQKHTQKTSSAAPIELFRNGGPVPGGPCDAVDSFENQITDLKVGGDPVALSMRVDCVRAEAQFTVRGKSKGWLAFGFNVVGEMSGTDTYQVRINDQGKPEVRNGWATGNVLGEDSLIAGAVGERTGDEIRVSFKRALYTGSSRDRVLHYGRRYFINVARCNTANAAFTAKHTERTPATAPRELFAQNIVAASPCDTLKSFQNQVVVPLDTTNVTVAYVVDCTAQKIRFTVVGDTKGWLAVGFTEFPNKMSGADTYQIRASGSTVEVRNGRAVGRAVIQDAILTGVSGSFVGDVVTATFERAFDTGLADKDVVFRFGSPYHINVARRNADADWTKKHDFRAWSEEPVELFTVGAPPATTGPTAPSADPCAVASATFGDSVDVTLGSAPVKVAYKVDCAAKQIEFTVSGVAKGWLAIAFATATNAMNGADTYQMRIHEGKAEVRNGFADEYDITEDALIAGATGTRTGDQLSVTFKRPFESSRGTRDVAFGVGKSYVINVAKRDADDTFTAKHNARAWTSKPVDFFPLAITTTPAATPAGTGTPIKDGPCASKPSFSNRFSVPVPAGAVSISYTIDCVAATIEFELQSSFKTPDAAWLAIGFSDAPSKMRDSDTYQLRLTDGKAQVRNGHANGMTISEDNVADATSGGKDGDALTVKFKRALKSTRDTDVDLSFGKKYVINAARRDTSGDWALKHTSKAWTADKVDLWTEAPFPKPDDVSSASSLIVNVVFITLIVLIALHH